jgi:4'-phosphopantetheinyl transferase
MSAASSLTSVAAWPALPPGEVHVWRVDLDLAPPRVAALAATLAADERARACRYRLDRQRDRWVVARGALRAILGGYLGADPAGLRLAADPTGKPHLDTEDGPAPLRFNLAHADALALVAVGWRREVGVDVERERPEHADVAVAHRVFATDEARALAAMPAALRCRAFFALWTAREAYGKAVGRGLEAMRETPAAGWTVRQLAIAPGYAAAVAVERGAEAVRCWRWGRPEARSSTP